MDAHRMHSPTDTTGHIRPRRRGAAAALGLATVLALGACGGRASGGSTTPTVSTPTAASASIDREVAQELREVDALLDELDATLAADLTED